MTSMSSEINQKEIEAQLKGNTLRIYWYLLKVGHKRPIGIREVQREIGLSSPSVATHHLEKLRELGLLEKIPSGEYQLVNEVKVGVLSNFVTLIGLMLPRYLFYSTLFTTMLFAYIFVYPIDLSYHNIMALIFGFLASLISWIETIRVWRNRPF
jgi:predicted DNA-binding transcriptional regulator